MVPKTLVSLRLKGKRFIQTQERSEHSFSSFQPLQDPLLKGTWPSSLVLAQALSWLPNLSLLISLKASAGCCQKEDQSPREDLHNSFGENFKYWSQVET